jgi:Uma2 family endonuclease
MTAAPSEYELPIESALLRFPHRELTAEQYDALPEEACRDIEVVDGMVVMSPKPTRRHQKVAARLWQALEPACGPEWTAVLDVDLRIADEPFHNRQPDVVVYRADLPDDKVLRPNDVLLVVEVVSPGSQYTDRKTKPTVYAEAGIRYYWRVETKDAVPVVFTYVLDEGTGSYAEAGTYIGTVKATVPFPVTVDLTDV